VLIMDERAAAELAAHGEQGYPHEICGVLLGKLEDGASVKRVIEVHRATNTNQERANDRYDLAPLEYRAIEDRARAQRLEILGIYHSHPDHPSRPSETDRLRAVDVWANAESWSYLILEVNEGKLTSQRSWVLRDEQFDQEQIEIINNA